MTIDDLRPDDAGSVSENPAPAASDAPATTAPAAPAAHGLRVGTVVWGLVLALLGIGVTAVGAGAALDLQAALIVLLVVAGTALLIGAFVTARRSRR